MALTDMSDWRTEYVRERDEWILGFDVGQSIDPSAACALQHVITGTGEMIPNEKTKTLRQGSREQFLVRHLERLPLGMAYPQQIQHVANLLGREPLVGAKLVVDYTGVGRPVFDMFQRAGLKPHGVLITAGNETTKPGGNIYHVPKQTLISQLEARLHSGELKIAANIADAGALQEELRDFARKVSESGRVSFNARSGSHDDLVLAVAIGLFLALGMNRVSSQELRV
jgi:hypothetical protein